MTDNTTTTERRTIVVARVDRSRAGDDQAHPKIGVQDERNRWYAIFDRKLWPRVEEGTELNVEVTRNGNYTHIVGVLGSAATPTAAGTSPTTRDTEIRRQVALKAAVDYVNANLVPPSVGDEGNLARIRVVYRQLLRLLEDPADDGVPF